MAKYTGENPWWGLGYLLAQNYNRNYDQRGIEKATEAGSQALEKAKAAIEGTDYAGANAALDKISDRYMNAGNALQGYEQAKAIPQGTGQNINLMLQQQPVQYEKMQGITPQRQPITPDYSFNADDFRANYIKEQQALGRPEHQIQQALAIMEPQIKNLDDQARQLRADETIKQLAGLAPDLDNSERLKLINSLLKDSPELGKAFLADSITNRDKWQAKRQDEMADKATNRALALKATGGVFRSGNGRSSNGGGSTGVRSYGGKATSEMKSPRFEYAQKRMEEINEWVEANPGQKLPVALEKERRVYEPYIKSVLANEYGYAPSAQISWEETSQQIQNLIQDNASNEEILKLADDSINQGYMPPEYKGRIAEILKNRNKEKQSDNSGWSFSLPDFNLFPDWGGEARTGAAAMTGDEVLEKAKQIATGQKPLFNIAHR